MRGTLSLVVAALLAALAPTVAERLDTERRRPLRGATTPFSDWPTALDGRALTPLPLTGAEQRFAHDFPGHIGRFSDGRREIVLKWVTEPNRVIHPAADCFRGLGFAVKPLPIERDGEGRSWGTFRAVGRGRELLIRERLVDLHGREFTDVSSWYWAALMGSSEGPWWLTTIAEPIR